MAERLQQSPLLAGDRVDIAYTVANNDHPEYGGIELQLRDVRIIDAKNREIKTRTGCDSAAPAT